MSENVSIWLERIAALRNSLLRQAATQAGLQAVHAEILEYLDRCNRYSNTAQALGEYLGLTKGSISQSLKLLESKGLVQRSPCPKDKRTSRLALTAEGLASLATLRAALPEPPSDKSVYGLDALLRDWQKGNAMRSFALCSSCRFNEARSGGGAHCGLTGEDLNREDVGKICREHAFA